MNLIDYGQFGKIFSDAGIEITSEQYKLFCDYADMLCSWNEKINLTAITDPQEIAIKHFFDSVYPFTLTEVPKGAAFLDVGTGAGFPSCPLKIVRNDLRLTLLDSLNKRINFLTSLSDKLGLDARCVHGRAEELGRDGAYREKYDIVTARAVANLTVLCEYCLPFVKTGGAFAALKGADGKAELNSAEKAIGVLGGKTEMCREYSLPGGDRRCLIVIRKCSPTPVKYPRNKGQMMKKGF